MSDDYPPPSDAAPTEGGVGNAGNLEFLTVRQLRDRVSAQGPRRWLVRGLIVAGDYGVHGAEPKAQKTWNATDLAVAVASGTPWLGLLNVDAPGPVLMFVGEGGQGNTLRRLDAAAEERGLELDDLRIMVCTRAPHLSDPGHLAQLTEMVGRIRPALVTLDPLYLSARGANMADLYSMGPLLERPQRICQEGGASLLVVTHFNRKEGTGARRITGAGPAEWGRFLITATVKSRHRDADTAGTRVITELDVIGGEIPDSTIRLDRRIWADDPDDLDSAMHTLTAASLVDHEDRGGAHEPPKLAPAAIKILEALEQGPASSKQIVDRIVQRHGHGLTRETVSRTMKVLQEAGLADCTEDESDGSGRFPTRVWLPVTPVTSQVIITGEVTCDPVTTPLSGHGVTSQVTGHRPAQGPRSQVNGPAAAPQDGAA